MRSLLLTTFSFSLFYLFFFTLATTTSSYTSYTSSLRQVRRHTISISPYSLRSFSREKRTVSYSFSSFRLASSSSSTTDSNTSPPPTPPPTPSCIATIGSRAEYDALTSQNPTSRLVVIDFQKSKCRPCMKAAPHYYALAEKHHHRASFYMIDADSSRDALMLLKDIGIKSVPTFYVYRSGSRVDTIQGARVDDLEFLVEQELRKEDEEAAASSVTSVAGVVKEEVVRGGE